MAKGFTPQDITDFKKKLPHIPLIVRGIMNKEDALIAVQHGADALWVSNGSGKTLDSQPSTINVLKTIVKTAR